jgi:thiosulfate/3-mercaptopyruvate sulfurtransferase
MEGSMTLTALLIPIMVAPMYSPPPVQQSREEPLVSVAWLAQHINDPNLVLLHVGERAEYDAGHIQGARYLTLDDISKPHDRSNASELALEMPTAAELKAALERLGISDDSRIVVYYGNDWISPATRVIFTLDHFGLGDRTSLLNGGMRAWKAANHAVTAAAPTVRPGRLTRLAARNNIVTAEFVEAQAGKPGFAVVDGRAAAYYDGVQAGTGGRKGHVPGALSVPYTSIADDNLHLRTRAELERIFRDAGVKPGDVVVGYCHIGQQATAMLFAARLLGHDVRLYDGSFQDWSLRNKPVTTERR